MGIRGFTTTSWSHETGNCVDRTKPINAWAIGLLQAQLEQLAADQEIVAVAFQEAWNCASPSAINAMLGFKAASREQEGVALLAQSGFSGAIKYQRIDAAANRCLIGGDVCIDPGGTRPCTGPDSGSRTATINLIEQAGYTDAWKSTQSGERWTGMANRHGCGVPDGNLYKRIDHVYTIGARVLSTERFGRAAPGADSPSDHVGLIAEIEIQ